MVAVYNSVQFFLAIGMVNSVSHSFLACFVLLYHSQSFQTVQPIRLLYGPVPPSYPQVSIEMQITLLHAIAVIIAFAFMVIYRHVGEPAEDEKENGKETSEKTEKATVKRTASSSSRLKFSLRRSLEKRSSKGTLVHHFKTNRSRSPSSGLCKSDSRFRSVSPARTVTLRSTSTKLGG